jgi:quercetin dioxygenase-like cupin family protein
LGYFFGEGPGEPYSIVRKDERRKVSRFASKNGVKYGYSYESLGFEKKDRHMEPFLVTLEPATVKSAKTSIHEGEEFIFVLGGEMEVTLGDHTDILYPGDSIYYDSTIPHRVQCRKGKETHLLTISFLLSALPRGPSFLLFSHAPALLGLSSLLFHRCGIIPSWTMIFSTGDKGKDFSFSPYWNCRRTSCVTLLIYWNTRNIYK